MNRVGSCAAIFVLIDATRSHRCLGQILIHEPLHHVDPVGKQVGDLSATKIEVGPPIPELLHIPVAPGTRTKKLLPIQACRFFLEWSLTQMVTVAMPPSAS